MGDALAEGVAARSKIALWLLKERFPDWELGLIHVSEAHSVIEALWHGVDEEHPLYQPSHRARLRRVSTKFIRLSTSSSAP